MGEVKGVKEGLAALERLVSNSISIEKHPKGRPTVEQKKLLEETPSDTEKETTQLSDSRAAGEDHQEIGIVFRNLKMLILC